MANLKKIDLESSIDEFLTENAGRLSADPKLSPYYNTRGKSFGSPVKREAAEVKMPRRRLTKLAHEEIVAAECVFFFLHRISSLLASTDPVPPPSDEEPAVRSTALTRTPARGALTLAGRIPLLPSSPADVAQAVDRSAVAVRERVVSIYADSGITEATQVTRESLSTVHSIIGLVSLFEWAFLRPEVLPNRYAFTVPAIRLLGTADYAVEIPDGAALLTAAFWSPVLLWLAVSAVVPSLFGFFFNLSAASGSGSGSSSRHGGGGRGGRSRPFSSAEYTVDPLTFSVAKALLVFFVLAQGASLAGWADSLSVARINAALYGGWKGALVGTAVTGLASLYDAVLRK